MEGQRGQGAMMHGRERWREEKAKGRYWETMRKGKWEEIVMEGMDEVRGGRDERKGKLGKKGTNGRKGREGKG